MWSRFRERLTRLRSFAWRDESPRLPDESRWYTEHTALRLAHPHVLPRRPRPRHGGRHRRRILATSITLETGGSGGIVTPIFFIGATSGAALARLSGVSTTFLAAVGL